MIPGQATGTRPKLGEDPALRGYRSDERGWLERRLLGATRIYIEQ
jgi:hypothetical protein